ncbi:hypothetical protein [Nitrosophilus labii]|uniref:hypothetical protein n=1 Tax=Nitrosophilus labii TaxID=2706014 RepID=UPI0016575F18|nr:hypothetical protein [Nitrosophilus labii]
MGQNIIHGKSPFRGSEVLQLDISMGVKNWFIHKIILLSPSILLILGYFAYKQITLFGMMARNESIEHFVWLDDSFIVILLIGFLGVRFIGKRFADLWQKKVIEANEQLIIDEYIRGAKLVCVDEFNKQYENEDKVIVFEIEDEYCDRKF